MADRNQAKKRRQAQNRNRRAEIAARTEAAQRKEREAREGTSGRPNRAARGGARGGARPAREAAVRRPRVERGGILGRLGWNEPGGSAVITGGLLTIVASLALLVVKIIPTHGPYEVVKKATEAGAAAGPNVVAQATRDHIMTFASVRSETVLQNAGARGLYLLLAPVVVALLSIAIARPINRKRTWLVGAIAMFFFVTFIAQSTGILYLPAFGVFAWGTYQAYRAARIERLAAAGAGTGGGTIATTGREVIDEDDDGDVDDDVIDAEVLDNEDDDAPRPARKATRPSPAQAQTVFGALFKPKPQRSAGRRRPVASEPSSAVEADPMHDEPSDAEDHDD